MNCEEIKNELPAMLYGELDETAAETVRAHLDTCAACREVFAELTRARNLLDCWHEPGISVPAYDPDQQRLSAESTGPRNSRRLLPLAAALAACLVLALILAVAGVEVRSTPAGWVIAFGREAIDTTPLAADLATDLKQMIHNEMEDELGGLFQAVVHHLEVVSREISEREHLLVDAVRLQRAEDLEVTRNLVHQVARDSQVELERTRQYLDEIADMVCNLDEDVSPGTGAER